MARGGKREGAGRKKKDPTPQEKLAQEASFKGLRMEEKPGETAREFLERYMNGALCEHYVRDGMSGPILAKQDENGEWKPVTIWAPLPSLERLAIAKALLPFHDGKFGNKPPPTKEPGDGLSEEAKSWMAALEPDEAAQLKRLIQAASARLS